jgi:hypothetical protein
MSHSFLPDPVDDFLQHPPRLAGSQEHKEALFQRTMQALPGPRRRPALVPLSVAAGLLLGVLLSYAVFHGAILNPRPAQQNQGRRETDPRPNRQEPAPPRLVSVDTLQPGELEWKAFDAPDDQERRRLYFQAGDLYLAASQNVEAAVRCYEQALSYCSARELEFDPNDNWLVMALKTDRRKDY